MSVVAKREIKSVVQMDSMNKYLTFLLGDESYAFNILKVKEIIEYGEITPMPMMPEFICGAINLRGKVVPVINLSLRMGKESADITRRTCIVIIELASEQDVINVGVTIDAVSKVLDLQAEEIEAVPDFGGNIRTDFIEGMGKVESDFVIILNMDRIISLEDIQSLSQVQQPVKKEEGAQVGNR